MKSMQERILERIEKIADEDIGIQVTQQQNFANTGHLIFTRVGQFEPLCDLAYDIQTSYATFDWRTDGKPIVGGTFPEGVRHSYVEYAVTGSIQAFLDKLEEDLSERLARA